MADGDVILLLFHVENGGEDGTFRGAVTVVEGIGRRRHGNQFFTAYRKALEGRIVGEVAGIHYTHLGGHETVRNPVFRDKPVQCVQVVPYGFRNDAYAGAAGEGGILVHHIGVETVTGKGGHAVSGLEMEVLLIPGAEVNQIALFQHAALGSTRGAGGIQQDVKAFRLGTLGRAKRIRQILNFFRSKDGTLVVHQWQQLLIGNEQFGIGVLYHEIEALLRVGRVQRLVGTTRLHGRQGGLGHPGVSINKYGHYILFPEAETLNPGSQSVCDPVQFPVSGDFSFEKYGGSVRRGFGLLPEQVHDGLAHIHLLGKVVETVQLL